MKVLQVMFDGGGNVPPQLLITRELVGRGHEVRILGPASLRERIEAAGARSVPYEQAPEGSLASPETDFVRDWEARTPVGAFARIRDKLMYGPSLLFARDVVAELGREPADVVAWDYLLVGAGIGAEAAGIPAATLIHTVYPLPAPGVPPFGLGLQPLGGPFGRLRDGVLRRGFELSFRPGVKAANAARTELGLDLLPGPFDQVERTGRILVLTSPDFDFSGQVELPQNVRFTGPVLDKDGDPSWTSPWPDDDPRPLILASFSTTYQGQSELAAHVVEAMGDLPVRGLLTTGPAIDGAALNPPANVEVLGFAPHSAVLPAASAAVCHGGLGTVHQALAAGVPVICVPHGRDQEDNAARVVAAKAGLRLKRNAGADRLRRAIAEALADPALTRGAQRLAADFALRDGAAAAADELEALAANPLA